MFYNIFVYVLFEFMVVGNNMYVEKDIKSLLIDNPNYRLVYSPQQKLQKSWEKFSGKGINYLTSPPFSLSLSLSLSLYVEKSGKKGERKKEVLLGVWILKREKSVRDKKFGVLWVLKI